MSTEELNLLAKDLRERADSVAYEGMGVIGGIMENASDEIEHLTRQRDELKETLIWIIENSSNDFMGTGSDRQMAAREEKQWNDKIKQALERCK